MSGSFSSTAASPNLPLRKPSTTAPVTPVCGSFSPTAASPNLPLRKPSTTAPVTPVCGSFSPTAASPNLPLRKPSTTAPVTPVFSRTGPVGLPPRALLGNGPNDPKGGALLSATGEPKTMDTYKLRIIINEHDIRKVTLNRKPETLEELKIKVTEKCQLQDDFKLQYEDTEFHNSPFSNLDDIEDLPDGKATVKVIPLTLNLVPIVDTQPGASGDIEIPSTSSVVEIPSTSSSATTRPDHWPDVFDIPMFPVEVEHQLRQANAVYLKDQKCLNPSWQMKYEIKKKLSEEMFKYLAYPKEHHVHAVALALIRKHPCLTEPGSTDGCSSWTTNLYYKMGNYRNKLRKSGCFLEVAINGGRRGATAARGLKRPKRNEANYLPDLPDGKDEATLEQQRKHLVEEMKKRNPSASGIAVMMDQTFALRRREIVVDEPPVTTMKERWPALFRERQVYAEFNRITTTHLETDFFDALDRYTPQLVTILKSKKGAIREKLSGIVQKIDGKPDVTALRTLVLRGLPLLLGEDPSSFYNTAVDCDIEDAWTEVSVGLLTVSSEDSPPSDGIDLKPVSTAVILEGGIVMDNLQNLPQALCLLFGLTYALNLNYPNDMKNTLNFIQRVMLGLGKEKLPPKLQSLKNLLSF